MRSAEYDAFGPWVLEVRSPDEIPPLYRDHPVDLGQTLLALKVPREIARRDANPSMNLYDHLLLAGHESLTVLSRTDAAYTARVIPYREVDGLEIGSDLLDGWFTVHGAQSLTVRYNASSEDVVDLLAQTVRGRYLADHGAHEGGVLEEERESDRAPLALGDLGDHDVALVTAHHAVLRRNPGAQLLGVSRRGPARLRTPSLMERVTEVLTPATVHATVVCGDAHELHVVHRGRHVTRTRKPAHALARTVIPRERISRVTATDHERLDGARVIDVRVGGANLLFSVASGSETERVLLGAAPR